jgi:ubiquinone/menaquinone biosynthesis C-methylase UbiE
MAERPSVDADMAAFYGLGEEADRLRRGAFRLEFVRTRELLERSLPRPPAVVLDCGGGPGAYAVWLAGQGYELELVDPIELHVEQAREAAARAGVALASAQVGDARRLPQRDGAVDAVLLLGPLYHLTERHDRLRALSEVRRVLRPGGVVVAAGISRFASTVDGLFLRLLDDPRFEAIVEQDLRDGRHRNPERHPRWFTTAYFHLPDELEAEVSEAGFRIEALLAVEGPGAFVADIDDRLDDPARRESLLRALRRVEGERSLLGASPHLLAVGRAP